MGILQAVTALRSCASSPAGQYSPTNPRGTEPIDTSTTPSDIDIPTAPSDPCLSMITSFVSYLLQTAVILFWIPIDIQLTESLGG